MSFSAQYCTVLYCTVLYCTALHCTVLYCTVLYCTVLYCTALHCTALHCTALYCTVLHCIVLYCTVLHCTALHCTALYCTLYWIISTSVRSNIDAKWFKRHYLIYLTLPSDSMPKTEQHSNSWRQTEVVVHDCMWCKIRQSINLNAFILREMFI